MSKLQKMLIGAAGASALALSISPAMARDYNGSRYEHNDRYHQNDRNDRWNRGEYDDRYAGRRNNYRDDYRTNYRRFDEDRVINQCIRAVNRHLGHVGRVDVTRIGDVRPSAYGNVTVTGRLVLETRRNDDRGRFTCTTNGYGNPSLSFRGLWNGR